MPIPCHTLCSLSIRVNRRGSTEVVGDTGLAGTIHLSINDVREQNWSFPLFSLSALFEGSASVNKH